MFLELPGKKLPKAFEGVTFTDATLKPNVTGGKRPKHLIPLGKSLWPDDVKEKIAALYRPLKVDALTQKLVEPDARVFGGQVQDGVPEFRAVNWDLLIDYFTWELAALTDDGEANRLQKAARRKYGGHFSHYEVYQDWSEMDAEDYRPW